MSPSPDIIRDFSALQSDVARLSQTNVELANRLMEAKRERDEQTAQMCQAIGYLSTIAEDCEAWLNGESDEPSMEFIKAVRDYARKAVNNG